MTHDVECQLFSVTSILTLSSQHERNRLLFGRMGRITSSSSSSSSSSSLTTTDGFEVLIKAMENFPEHRDIQHRGIIAIQHLCTGNYRNQKAFADANGCLYLINAMEMFAQVCYVMLCYVMLCYVMLYYITLCCVILCYIILYYVILRYVMLCYVILLCYRMWRFMYEGV